MLDFSFLGAADLVRRAVQLDDAMDGRKLNHPEAVAAVSEREEIDAQLPAKVPQGVEDVFALAACLSGIGPAIHRDKRQILGRNIEAAQHCLLTEADAGGHAFIALRHLVVEVGRHAGVIRDQLDSLFEPLAQAREASDGSAREAVARLEVELVAASTMVTDLQDALALGVEALAGANEDPEVCRSLLAEVSRFVSDRAAEERRETLGRPN